MKKFLFTFFTLVLIGAGCTSSIAEEMTQTDTSVLQPDFYPESGSAPSPSSDPRSEGPWNGRFMTATSTDGLLWEKTGVVIGDQLNVPDLEYGPNNWLYLYFTGYTLGEKQNTTAVAISTDEGSSWIFKYLSFVGVDRDPVDLSLFYDKVSQTFFGYGNYIPQGGTKSTALFTSADGLTFTFVDEVFSSNPPGIVPSIIVIDDTVHLYTNQDSTSTIQHVVSHDGGFTFETADNFVLLEDNKKFLISNIVPLSEGYRAYAYDRGSGTIAAFFSMDGSSWESEGIVLRVDLPELESTFVKDPAVIQKKDGSWLMVYPTNIPE